MSLPISVTILVKNAQETMRECLESLQSFDEIILLDNGSTDDTLSIAQSFSNVKIYESEFIGFGALKNLAISYAKHDWILSIDSDEVLESDTLALIESLTLDSHTIYALPRKNLYNGEWIKACGWYPDYVWRLFNKTFTRFNDNFVHESVIIPKNAHKLKLSSGIKHYAYDNIAHLLEKLQRYSSLWAEQNTHKHSSPFKALTHGFWTFLRDYFLKKGIFYGYKGFVISLCNGLGTFFKYMKLYELQSTTPPRVSSLIITTYNQKERLALVLDSVKNLAFLPNEVLIADDGSTKDTKELIQSYQTHFPCPLRHIWHEDKGFRLSSIRNLAIKEAQGEYIIIIDGDMILDAHFIKDHLRYAKKNVFLQGSRVILDSKRTQNIMESREENAFRLAFKQGGFKAKRSALLCSLIFATSKITATFFDKKDLIKGIRGCNMSFYKADCININGFNEAFIGWGREDSEFVARFLFNGGELRRLKFGGVAYHLYHPENPRTMLESNHNIYLQTLINKSRYCEQGIESTR
ncbi:glycosyltransferase [Helicobacter sp. MIT 21-1697]|uniref:glycosyltransferase family 2 protein n=1 Tax=Helicobacter sp. MIT 21-1697 TaxID=2993733 RepID=UPI00224B82DB|nr:glycosyltransferase [Helicobacter sp. MIT 21-1697]MCX2717910.1 glycosyltransferase [Helicobacter sp. MIT 21-1697]